MINIRVDCKYDYDVTVYDHIEFKNRFFKRYREDGFILLSKISDLLSNDVCELCINEKNEIKISIYDWLEEIDKEYIINIVRSY